MVLKSLGNNPLNMSALHVATSLTSQPMQEWHTYVDFKVT
jgi:hypothetical protein